MSIVSTHLVTSAKTMAGGSSASAGTGEKHTLTVGGTWAADEEWTLLLIDSLTGLQTQIGAGNITREVPSFVFTYNDKEYLLVGSTVFFSADGLPVSFNDPNLTGNGFVVMSNQFSSPESLVALAPFQGKLVFFSRHTTQIWQVNSDPNLWTQVQVLQNVGTIAKLSVQALGELDVFFLADNGIRDIRPRSSSDNGEVSDIGSPIDEIIQPILAGLTDAQKATACGIIEPNTNRYWLYLNGVVYVLSYFPTSKIVAWSKYLPTYDSAGVQTAFTPQKFVVHKGRVYARGADDAIYLYGGTDNNTYDNVVATVELPWTDFKTPSTMKQFQAIDYILEGAWQISVGTDPVSGTLQLVASDNAASVGKGQIGYSDGGTHLKLKAVTTGATAAKLSSLSVLYQEGQAS